MRTRTAIAAGALSAFAALAIAPAASADIVDDGQWWFTDYQIQGFHDDGIDGSGITIGVIDDAINTELPMLQGTDLTVHEPSFCYGPGGEERSPQTTDVSVAYHGSNVVAQIVGNGTSSSGAGIQGIAPEAAVRFYGIGGSSEDCYDANGDSQREWDVFSAFEQAVADGVDVISVSVGTTDFLELPIAAALRENIVVVGSLSNQQDLSIEQMDSSPGVNNGVLSVGAFGDGGTLQENEFGALSSPYTDVLGPGIDLLIQGDPDESWDNLKLGSGASYATPIVAGNVALTMQKYPEATPNQILQSITHNTGAEPHELQRDDEYGYGLVDTISLLAVDPTQYEDVNPFISLDEDDLYFEGPTVDQINGTASAEPSPSDLDPEASPSETDPSATSSPTADEPAESGGSWLIPAIVVLAIIIVAAGVVVVIVKSKNRNKGDSDGSL